MPSTLLGSDPAEWYEGSEQVSELAQLGLGDWTVREQQSGYMVKKVTPQVIAKLRKEVRGFTEDARRLLDARTKVLAKHTKDPSHPINSGYEAVDGFVAHAPTQEERETWIAERVAAKLAQLGYRVLIAAERGPEAPWRSATLVMADRGPITADVAEGERIIWMRRKDARWRPMVTGAPGNTSLDDDQLAELSPKEFEIIEKMDQ